MLLSVAVVRNPACFPNVFVGEVQKIFVLCVSKKAVFGSVVLALQKKKKKQTYYSLLMLAQGSMLSSILHSNKLFAGSCMVVWQSFCSS